jgi:hypothetical protein
MRIVLNNLCPNCFRPVYGTEGLLELGSLVEAGEYIHSDCQHCLQPIAVRESLQLSYTFDPPKEVTDEEINATLDKMAQEESDIDLT